MIRPVHDKIVLEVIEEKNTTSSGIILPDNIESQYLSAKAKVVAITKELSDKINLKEGNIVLFFKNAGISITVEKQSFMVVKELDIIGIFDE